MSSGVEVCSDRTPASRARHPASLFPHVSSSPRRSRTAGSMSSKKRKSPLSAASPPARSADHRTGPSAESKGMKSRRYASYPAAR